MNLPKRTGRNGPFGASLLLVAGVLAYLIIPAPLRAMPAHLVVQLGEPVQQSQHFSIPVAVRANQGDSPAEDVVVRVTLDAGGEPEEAEFSVTYLPVVARAAAGPPWPAIPAERSRRALWGINPIIAARNCNERVFPQVRQQNLCDCWLPWALHRRRRHRRLGSERAGFRFSDILSW